MSPDQGLEALLEGSNHNSDYQTVSKFDNLIKIVHQTFYDQGIQYRPSVQNHSLFPRIYGPCHSRKSINRAPFLLQKEPGSQSLKRSRERSKTALAPLLLLDHRRTTARRPYTSPDHRRTTSRRPYTPPDHQPKALHFAGPPPDHQPKALHFAGPPPDHHLKALRSAQGPKFSLRPYTPLKARSSA
ncbi:hypothetical protein M5K25_025654 [Dendrobium thyrsiflorum]|uniref:Uncharacterized protein n=1 Tax=Dendrobium thyrsiflorum TaxID=117978 RepID=A0ABD0U4L6_DENTH